MGSIKKYIHHLVAAIEAISPALKHGMANMWYALKRVSTTTLTTLSRLLRKAGRNIKSLLLKIWELPRTTKMFVSLLSFLTLFIIWQIFAYQFQQSTFVTTNIVLASILTLVTNYVVISTQKQIDIESQRNDELQEQCNARSQEISKLKADIYDMRQKERKIANTEKNINRFVECVKQLHAKPSTGLKYQYIVDAMAKSFDVVSGIAIFARREDQPELFDIAGHYALADDFEAATITASDGSIGQVISDAKVLVLKKVPAEYLSALSGLGRSQKLNVYLLPFVNSNNEVVAVLEVACFGKLDIEEKWTEIANTLQDEL